MLNHNRLAVKLRKQLNRFAADGTPPFLCDISIWECAMLYQSKRIEISLSFDKFIALATALAMDKPLATSDERITDSGVVRIW